jgi:GAF domain-containing protein
VENQKLKEQQRYTRLRTRLALSFSILAVLAIGLTIATLYFNFSQTIRQDLRRRVTNIAAVASLQQNGDEFAAITSEQDPLYEKFRVQNLKIRRSDADIAYVFTASKDDKGLYFVVDAGDPGEENIARFGERYEDPSATLANNYDTMTQAIADPAIYTDIYGSFLSAYAPIFTADGKRVGIIGVDFLADTVISKERQFLWISLFIFAVSIPVVALAGWLLGNNLAAPISVLAQTANEIASGNLNRRAEVKSNIIEIVELTKDFNAMADTTKDLVGGLEKRVSERTQELAQQTAELEVVSTRNERRATQLEAVAEVSRAISSIRNLSSLLTQVSIVISERFNFYHVGVFLLDEGREYAILSAANSQGGRRMLERQHKLKVGQAGIVGYVTSTGNPRIALDTGADAIFFDNPDLPDTRSEIALPLKARNQIFGALDVQSTETGAFSEEDISILGILADQVSLAIENARSFEQTSKSLEKAESLYNQFLHQQWAAVAGKRELAGYRYNIMGTTSIPKSEEAPAAQLAIEQGKIHVYQDSSQTYRMAVPIKMRDEVIAVLNIQSISAKPWTKDEMDIAQSAADRVALALENARLLDDSQRRAAKERVIGEISSKISSSVNLDSILQTAAKELGLAISDSEVVVQVQTSESE